FQAEDGIRDFHVTGVQTCALPILTCVPVLEPERLLAGGLEVVQQTVPDDVVVSRRDALVVPTDGRERARRVALADDVHELGSVEIGRASGREARETRAGDGVIKSN